MNTDASDRVAPRFDRKKVCFTAIVDDYNSVSGKLWIQRLIKLTLHSLNTVKEKGIGK